MMPPIIVEEVRHLTQSKETRMGVITSLIPKFDQKTVANHFTTQAIFNDLTANLELAEQQLHSVAEVRGQILDMNKQVNTICKEIPCDFAREHGKESQRIRQLAPKCKNSINET